MSTKMSKSTKQSTPQEAVVKATKPAKTKSAKEATPLPEVVAEVVAEVAPASTPAPAKKSAKKAKVEQVIPAKEEVASTETESVPATTEQPIASTLAGDYSEFMNKLQQVSSLLSLLKSEFRSLEKKASRELRTATKAGAKRKRKNGNRSPSGFVKPTLISDELASFLGRQPGSEMARTEVTREINEYIRTHKLQHPENGRRIQADEKLMGLLKLTSTDDLTYFNLQRYMSPHFAKSVPAVPAAVVV
jgi:chromatin remodeling complex protein RSC6